MLSILIPTYNRAQYLARNLQGLCACISEHGLQDEVSIVVSNNASPDDTIDTVQKVKEHWREVRLELVTLPENIGSVRNVLSLLHGATTPYILFLGDDDYLRERYLLRIVDLVREGRVHLAVPSNEAVSLEGEPLGYSRDVSLPERKFEAGFAACRHLAWRGHQMSGLLFRRADLAERCRRLQIENMYLFIYLVAASALSGPSAHLTADPVRVSVPTQQAKGWSYGDDGMLGEVFVNFARLEGISGIQRSRLEMHFLWAQYWRYAMYLKLGPWAFLRCLFRIVAGPWTSMPTRLLFPMALPFLLPLKAAILALNGELLATLRRKVDI